MVGELAARHALGKEVVEGVSERTGGVPLFVEEVTRLLLERGEDGGLQAIPPTLQQSLAARLDRLREAREVAQIGAVLGRDFTYILLRAVGGVDDPALQSGLDRLAEADLLITEGVGHESAGAARTIVTPQQHPTLHGSGRAKKADTSLGHRPFDVPR
jgi:predicted ATPase